MTNEMEENFEYLFQKGIFICIGKNYIYDYL